MAYRDWYRCKDCGHKWQTRKRKGGPPSCPSCSSKQFVNQSKRKRERERKRKARKREERRKRWEKRKELLKAPFQTVESSTKRLKSSLVDEFNIIDKEINSKIPRYGGEKSPADIYPIDRWRRVLETIVGLFLFTSGSTGFLALFDDFFVGLMIILLYFLPGTVIEPHLREKIDKELYSRTNTTLGRFYTFALILGLLGILTLFLGILAT